MTKKKTQPAKAGQVAIVEIAATEKTPAVYLVEVALDGETLTISDQEHNLPDDIRDLARQIVIQVRSNYHE